jgi:phosphopantetheinyl transferase
VVLHGSVGLDVEPEGRLLEPALRLIATQEELARVAAGGGSATRLAVAKEAVLKAAGGRYTQLKQVSLGTEMGCFAEVGYWLQYPDLGAGYVAALDLSESCPALQPVYWEPTQLLKRFLASG